MLKVNNTVPEQSQQGRFFGDFEHILHLFLVFLLLTLNRHMLPG